MVERALSDWMFEVALPERADDGWWFTIEGARRWRWGPFPDEQRAQAACHAVFQRWRRAARERGGWAWKSTPRRWIVTVPRSCRVDGVPFRSEACTRHTA